MNKKKTPYLYILFLTCFSYGIFAQDLTLNLTSKDSLEAVILNSISYQETHKLEKEIYDEIHHVHRKIKRLGFFTSTVENITQTNKNYQVIFKLGKRTDEILIIIPNDINFKKTSLKVDSLKLKITELDNFTSLLMSELDSEGLSFSEISFKNPKYIQQTLVVELKISQSKKRTINKVVVKGYENFPNSFLKNYFQIIENTTFSKEKLKEISSLTKLLSFVKEKKTPEVLFKKDSTVLYLFLDKLKTNSIDAIINIASKENGGGTLLNGNLDLKLNNIFNTGENFELFWNRVAEEKSQFRIKSTIPYLFNSSISTKFKFDIYRQDSTFLNTKFDFELDIHLNSKSKLSLTYTTENSNYLLDTNTNLDSYSNYFLGAGYEITLSSFSELYDNKALFTINPTFGKRTSDITDRQFKLQFNGIFNATISPRSYLYIKNETGFLDSKNLLTNELFRIGGVNSIRGFNEQSIFTSRFSYFNLEYRYLTSRTSYLHSISDIGFVKTLNASNETVLGLGIGYLFTVKNSQVNLAYVLGKSSANSFTFNNSKLNIRFKSFF